MQVAGVTEEDEKICEGINLVLIAERGLTNCPAGKATRGYDPSQDIVWLRSEIVQWIRGNLMEKWGSITRRHAAIKGTAVETLRAQFSGYGANKEIVARVLDRLALKEPLPDWSNETVALVVDTFVDEKFPTVVALNKMDHPDADKNVAKIAKANDPKTLVLCSAISEVFLRRLAKQGFVRYTEGSEFVDTRQDLIDEGDPDGGGLKELDEKLQKFVIVDSAEMSLKDHRTDVCCSRIDNLKDLVLYRFGSTGVNQVLTRAAELLGLTPVFPVRNISTYASGERDSGVFRDCVLVKK